MIKKQLTEPIKRAGIDESRVEGWTNLDGAANAYENPGRDGEGSTHQCEVLFACYNLSESIRDYVSTYLYSCGFPYAKELRNPPDMWVLARAMAAPSHGGTIPNICPVRDSFLGGMCLDKIEAFAPVQKTPSEII